MGKLRPFLIVGSLLALASSALLAQEARQGPVVPVQRFDSPMVIDLPLVVGPIGVWTSALRTPEEQKRTRHFICDHAYVYDLVLKPGKRSREGVVELAGRVTIAGEHGEDRRVDVLAEIVTGETVLGSSKISNLKVEEDERSTRPVLFHLTEQQIADLATLKVRLTLDVRSPKE
jgi:hypothetical protein